LALLDKSVERNNREILCHFRENLGKNREISNEKTGLGGGIPTKIPTNV
jgi:hypothetical protein